MAIAVIGRVRGTRSEGDSKTHEDYHYSHDFSFCWSEFVNGPEPAFS
jgi:hypothetical protein